MTQKRCRIITIVVKFSIRTNTFIGAGDVSVSRRRKTLIGGVIAAVVLVGGITAYIQGKHYVTRKEVKEHLTQNEGIAAADIEDCDSFIANLPGDRNWMVSVGIKGEKGHYYYYYDREQGKVALESRIVDGEEYSN